MKISVKAHPKARQAKIKKIDDVRWEIWVREAPDKGKANAAIIEALSDDLKIAQSKLSIVSGQASKNKIIEIHE